MSLQGLLARTPGLREFVGNVREFARDYPEVNRIIAGQESSDRQIAWAVMDALSDFNGTPHLTNLSLLDLIALNQTHLLTRMAVIGTIESVGLLQTRNHIDYATGGTRVSVNNKTPLLMEWLRLFQATTEQRKQQVKVALNIGYLLGTHPSGVHSEYLWTNASSYSGYGG